MSEKFVACTKDEMNAWIAAYPRKLKTDVFGAGEPPLVTFNDFSLGDWPDSVVASYKLPCGYDAEPKESSFCHLVIVP